MREIHIVKPMPFFESKGINVNNLANAKRGELGRIIKSIKNSSKAQNEINFDPNFWLMAFDGRQLPYNDGILNANKIFPVVNYIAVPFGVPFHLNDSIKEGVVDDDCFDLENPDKRLPREGIPPILSVGEFRNGYSYVYFKQFDVTYKREKMNMPLGLIISGHTLKTKHSLWLMPPTKDLYALMDDKLKTF